MLRIILYIQRIHVIRLTITIRICSPTAPQVFFFFNSSHTRPVQPFFFSDPPKPPFLGVVSRTAHHAANKHTHTHMRLSYSFETSSTNAHVHPKRKPPHSQSLTCHVVSRRICGVAHVITVFEHTRQEGISIFFFL